MKHQLFFYGLFLCACLSWVAISGLRGLARAVGAAGPEAAVAAAPARASDAPRAAGPLAHHAVIISIDGCRPDVLLRAATPVIHDLLARASFTFYAQTTDLAVTLPSHTSMLTGVVPATHGIDFNTDPPAGIYPKVPTILEIAHDDGMTTGVFSTKSKFSLFTRPGVIDDTFIINDTSSPDDPAVARAAVQSITTHRPNVMLVHFGNTDRAGHAKGWGSPEQMAALQTADGCIGEVLRALKDAGIDEDTLVIITSDHGGAGLNHGADDPRSRFIPWIALGPHIRKNHDLTGHRALAVHTEDTFATACYFLGLPFPPHIDGKPVLEVLANRDLMVHD